MPFLPPLQREHVVVRGPQEMDRNLQRVNGCEVLFLIDSVA